MKVACEENNMDETKSANRFSSRDWLTLALGIALALLWREVFSFENLMYGLPALGAGVFNLHHRHSAASGRGLRFSK